MIHLTPSCPAEHAAGQYAQNIARAARCAALAAVSLMLAACQPAVLDPAGPVGRAQLSILVDSLAIMLAIVVPTMIGTLACAWWFRRGNARAQRLPYWSYSGRIEMVTWGVPLLTIMLLGGVAWVGAHELDPGRSLPGDKPLEIQAVSLDWKWLFIYPEQGVASLNEVAVPAGKPVHFLLTSGSVMNAFFVPQLGSMIYTMNGMVSELHLQADHEGTFGGLSSHYSGDGFSDMHFAVRSLDGDGFARWIAAAHADAAGLDAASYAQLARQSTKDPARQWGRVDPELFDQIVSQHLPPGPGPKPTTGGKSGSAKAEGGPGTSIRMAKEH